MPAMASRRRTCGAKYGNEFRITSAAEGLADDDGTAFDRRDGVDGPCEIGSQHLEALRVISKRVRGNAVGSLDERHLPVEQLSGPIHAGHQDHRASLASNRQPGVVVAMHGRRP